MMACFKKYAFQLHTKFNLTKEMLELDSEYLELKKQYEDIERKMIDPDFFFMTLGENFEELPK